MASQNNQEPWVLTDKQMTMVSDHLEKVLTDGCWICKKNEWIIFPRLSGEKPYDPHADYLSMAESNPKVRITCKNCGNINYFSTDLIGVTRAAEDNQID